MTNEPEEKRAELAQFARMGRGIREILQAVEDALIDAGYDDFMVKTNHGSFRWQTVERAREDRGAEPEPDPDFG